MSHSSSLRLACLVCLCVFFSVCPGAVVGAGGAEIDRSFPRGHVSALLHVQGLSHFALHSPAIQRVLSSPYSPSTVAIVGVEWGDDVARFAAAGFRVIGVEPIPKFADAVRRKIDDPAANAQKWDVTLHPVAVGDPLQGETVTSVTYDNHGSTNLVHDVPFHRLDELIREELAVLSVDIQGDEVSVLRGASGLLKAGNVSTIWVEAIACNRERVREMLDILDAADFIILDFVPWGKPKQFGSEEKEGGKGKGQAIPKTKESFTYNHSRPSAFDDYVDWMCAQKEKDNGFQWLQTDFLAVHRDVFEDVLSMLLNLGETVCDLPDADCVLRNILHSLPEYGRDATLIEEDDFIDGAAKDSEGEMKTEEKTPNNSEHDTYDDEEPEDYEDYIDHDMEGMEAEMGASSKTANEEGSASGEKQDL